jgi:hypothetical protein
MVWQFPLLFENFVLGDYALLLRVSSNSFSQFQGEPVGLALGQNSKAASADSSALSSLSL